MKKDIILCGVGGDGIVSVAKIISDAALNKNLYLKQSEIHGMSQRGGSVFSHLRISDKPIYADVIPEGQADIMITEITEAPYYVQTDNRLAAPLLNSPFTHGEIGVLMQKGQEDLLQMVNNLIEKKKADGSLRQLHEKYGLVYSY